MHYFTCKLTTSRLKHSRR